MKKQEKISRLELIEIISDKANIPRSKANKMLNVLKDVFKESAIQNKNILIRNFFKATPYTTSSRKIKVPKTKRVIKTKPKRKIKVHIADTFIKEINNALRNKK